MPDDDEQQQMPGEEREFGAERAGERRGGGSLHRLMAVAGIQVAHTCTHTHTHTHTDIHTHSYTYDTCVHVCVRRRGVRDVIIECTNTHAEETFRGN